MTCHCRVMSRSFGVNVRTVLSLRVCDRDLLRPAPAGDGRLGALLANHCLVTIASTPRGRTAPRGPRVRRHTACMPVAHDANAAYSVSRSDAKAAPRNPPTLYGPARGLADYHGSLPGGYARAGKFCEHHTGTEQNATLGDMDKQGAGRSRPTGDDRRQPPWPPEDAPGDAAFPGEPGFPGHGPVPGRARVPRHGPVPGELRARRERRAPAGRRAHRAAARPGAPARRSGDRRVARAGARHRPAAAHRFRDRRSSGLPARHRSPAGLPFSSRRHPPGDGREPGPGPADRSRAAGRLGTAPGAWLGRSRRPDTARGLPGGERTVHRFLQRLARAAGAAGRPRGHGHGGRLLIR